MQDNEAIPFHDLLQTVRKNPAQIKIMAPKPNTKSPITTGSIVWPNGQLIISGPPCTILNPVQEDGTVSFGKVTVKLNPPAGPYDTLDGQEKMHYQERETFTEMLREMDKLVESRLTTQTPTYFPSHPDLPVDKIFVSPSLSEPSDPKYAYNLSCKIDLARDTPKENFHYDAIMLDVREVVEDKGQFVYKSIPNGLRGLTNYDVVVPTFRGAYVYFQCNKNMRTKEVEQYTCKTQWILQGLFRIRHVKDLKRKNPENQESSSWVGALSLRRYMSDAPSAENEDENDTEKEEGEEEEAEKEDTLT